MEGDMNIYYRIMANSEDVIFTLEEVAGSVAKVFNLTVDEMLSKSRRKPLPDARFIFFRKAIDNVKINGKKPILDTIAKFSNRGDHAVVINGLKQYKNLYSTDKEFKRLADEVSLIKDKLLL